MTLFITIELDLLTETNPLPYSCYFCIIETEKISFPVSEMLNLPLNVVYISEDHLPTSDSIHCVAILLSTCCRLLLGISGVGHSLLIKNPK